MFFEAAAAACFGVPAKNPEIGEPPKPLMPVVAMAAPYVCWDGFSLFSSSRCFSSSSTIFSRTARMRS